MIEHPDETPDRFLRVTFLDRVIRFFVGAPLAAIGMLALVPLFTSIDVFVPVTGFVAFLAGLATAIWGDRFLVPLLRAIGRTR